MKRDEPENLDLLAAEYVLGTLRGPARRSFERRRRRDPFVDRRIGAWEERFAWLALRLKPVAPSADVWPAIQRRIGGGSHGVWRALAAAVALVAVLGFGWIVWQELRPPQATAEFASASGETLWHVELAARGDRLEVATLGKPAVPDARARELWALPEGGAPVSLGLCPRAATRAFRSMPASARRSRRRPISRSATNRLAARRPAPRPATSSTSPPSSVHR